MGRGCCSIVLDEASMVYVCSANTLQPETKEQVEGD
jgi:hypothetical protein